MKQVTVLAFGGVSLGLTLLVATPSAAPAQMFYGFAGGLNVARQVPVDPYGFHGNVSHGFAVEASVGRNVTRRFGWRVDAFASQFHFTRPSDFAGVLCAYHPPPGTCCGICPRDTSTAFVGVGGLAASAFLKVIPSARRLGMYLIGGAETDYVYEHPTTARAFRLGVSAGAGVAVPVGGPLQAFVEARYHALVSPPSQPTWLAPVTFGLQY